MSVNKHRPHLYVIPEDDAERRIAIGFVLRDGVDQRRVQVVAEAGGWLKVIETFQKEYAPKLSNQHTHVVMLIDFDGIPMARRTEFDNAIPEEYRSRVFVIGPKDEPEDFKKALNGISFEKIGATLASDCQEDNIGTWGHEHLMHNEPDRKRLYDVVRPFLFPNV